jgi:hypothetical protein
VIRSSEGGQHSIGPDGPGRSEVSLLTEYRNRLTAELVSVDRQLSLIRKNARLVHMD